MKCFAVITVSSFLLGCQLNFLHFMIWGSNCCWFIQNKPFWQQILSSYKYESRGDFLLSFFTFELRACLKTHRDSCNTKFPQQHNMLKKILLKCFCKYYLSTIIPKFKKWELLGIRGRLFRTQIFQSVVCTISNMYFVVDSTKMQLFGEFRRSNMSPLLWSLRVTRHCFCFSNTIHIVHSSSYIHMCKYTCAWGLKIEKEQGNI